MSFNDNIVYMIFAIAIISTIVAYLVMMLGHQKERDDVSLPKAEGFTMFEITDWKVGALGPNATKISLEYYSRYMIPIRILLKNNDSWKVQVWRREQPCEIKDIVANVGGKEFRDQDLTPFVSGTEKVRVDIYTQGKLCSGSYGHGYNFKLILPIEQYNTVERIESGTIKGFFS